MKTLVVWTLFLVGITFLFVNSFEGILSTSDRIINGIIGFACFVIAVYLAFKK